MFALAIEENSISSSRCLSLFGAALRWSFVQLVTLFPFKFHHRDNDELSLRDFLQLHRLRGDYSDIAVMVLA